MTAAVDSLAPAPPRPRRASPPNRCELLLRFPLFPLFPAPSSHRPASIELRPSPWPASLALPSSSARLRSTRMLSGSLGAVDALGWLPRAPQRCLPHARGFGSHLAQRRRQLRRPYAPLLPPFDAREEGLQPGALSASNRCRSTVSGEPPPRFWSPPANSGGLTWRLIS